MSDVPFPICPHHALRLYRNLTDLVMSGDRDPLLKLQVGFEEIDELRAKVRATTLAHQPQDDCVVYYLLVDGLVKIGYTSNLTRRLAGYPPTAKLLATEPGDGSREAQRHREFNEYLTAGREWFTPGPRLRAHIEGLADYCAA